MLLYSLSLAKNILLLVSGLCLLNLVQHFRICTLGKTSGIVLRISFHEVKKEVSARNKSLKKCSLEVTTDNGQKLSYKRTVVRTKNKCF